MQKRYNTVIAPSAIPSTASWREQKVHRGENKTRVTAGDRIGYGAAGLGLGLVHGAASAIEGIGDFFAGTALQIVGDKEGAKEVYQNSWSGDFRKWIEEEINPDDNKAFSTYLDVVSGVGNAATQVGLMMLTGGASGYLGAGATAVKVASVAPLFISATGSGTAEAVQTTGELGAKENIYGVLTGSTELATEMVLGAGGKILKGSKVFGKAESEAVKGITKHAILRGTISSAAGEFGEEALSEAASVWWKNLTGVDPNAKLNGSDIVRAGFMGAVSGGVLGFGNSAITTRAAQNAGRKIIENGTEKATVAEASALVKAATSATKGNLDNMDSVQRVKKALELYQSDANAPTSRKAYYLGQMSAGLFEVGMYESSKGYRADIFTTVAQGGEAATKIINGANALFEETLGRKLTAEDFSSPDSVGTKMLASVSLYNDLATPTDAELVDISIRNESAVAFSPDQMASDIAALKDGEGTAVYNLGGGRMAIVTKRKGDGSISVGLVENKNTNAIKATHGVKSIEGAVALVKSMQDGTYGQPRATATPAQPTKPTKKKSILDEEFKLEISEKNVEMPKKPEAAKAPKKPEAPKKAEVAKKAEAKKKPDVSRSTEKSKAEEPKTEKKKAPEKEAKAKTESEPKKEAPEELSAVEDRLRGKKYAGTTFTAEEINAARADFKYLDALSPKVRSDILIMRRSAKTAKIDAQKVKGLTRLMAAYKFSATFSSEIKSNGFWRHGKNLLVINPNDIYQTTFGHELSHRVEDYKGYDAFASVVESLVGKARLDSEMKKYLADYNAAAEANGWKKWDAEANAEDLKREAVANLVGKYLSNAEYIDKLANADRNFVYRVYRSIKGMKRDLALANQISTEADTSKLTEYRTIRRMEKVFETALGLTEKQRNGETISRMPIGYDDKGRPVAIITENILDGVAESDWIDTVKNALKKYSPGIPISGRLIKVNEQTRSEYTGSKNTKNYQKKNRPVYIDKMKAAGGLDDIVLASTNYVNEDLNHQRKDKFVQFARGNVLMRIGQNDYSAKVIVGFTNGNNMVLYDVLDFSPTKIQIKKVKSAVSSPSNHKVENSSNTTDSSKSIPDSVEKVNTSDENSEKISRSVSSTDRAYLEAVERGDMDTAQKMVDEAARNAGYDLKAYHGTNADFFTFDKNRVGKGNDQYGAGFYFATDKEAATHYGRRVIPSALKIENPFTVSSANLLNAEITFDDEQAYEIVKRHPLIYDPEESPLGDYYDSYWESGVEEWMIEDLASQYTDLGYLDSDLFRNYPNELHEAVRDVTGHDGVVVELTNGEKFYVAWFDNQIKSADPVTYDDDGNVIPLSERFNAEDNDIRYSVSSRIVFGTPANTVGVKERAKGVIEKVKGIVTDKAERRAALEKLHEATDHFSVYWSNSFAAVETQLRRMKDGTFGRMTRQAAQEQVQLIRFAEAKGLGMLTVAQYKFDGTPYEHGEALLKILDPTLAKEGETITGQDAEGNEVSFKAKGGELGGELYQEVSDYLGMLNAIEREAVGKNPYGNMTVAQMQSIVTDYESKHPEFKEIAEKWSRFNQNLLQYRVDAGLMSQDTADELHARYPHYIPMMKPTTDNLQSTGAIRGKSSVEVANNIRKAKGGDHLVNDPIATYCNMVLQTVKAAQVNDLMLQLYKTADDKHVITDERLKEIGEEMDNVAEAYINDPDSNPDAFGILNALTVKASDGLTNAVYFYDNGVRKAMKVSKDIFTGLQGANKSGYNFTGGWMFEGMAAINSNYKRLITSMNPFFSPKNMIRDFMDGLLHSRFKLREFLIEYVKVGKEMAAGKITDDPLWSEFIANGGLQSSLFDRHDAKLSKRSKRTGLESSDAGLVGKTMQTVENFNVLIEALPRFVEYKLTRNKGGSVAEALNNSAEVTTNFARSGVAGGFLNKTIMPFLNPSIQGFSKPIRNVIENGTPKGLVSLLIRAALLGVAPIILNNLMYSDDEDYDVLEDSTKENNFVIKIGDSWLKIPRGRVVSVVSGLYNRSYNQMTGRYVDWKDYLDNVKSQATPIDSITRTIFSPFKDVQTNTTWYGGAIENESMQNLAPEDRYDEYTSSLAIAIGKVTGKAFDLSPKKVHYLLDQYSGIIGDLLLPMTSTATRSNPLSSNFSVDVTQNTNLSDRFYKLYNDSMYKKNKGDEDAYYLYKRLGETKQQVSELYKQIKEINTSNLSKSEKRSQVAVLRATINQLYKAAIADAGAYSKAVKAATPIQSYYKVVKVTAANAKKLGAEKESIGKYALTYNGETVRFFDDSASAEEYKTSVARKTTYAEANRLVYGAQYALNQYSEALGTKAETIARLGVDAETFYSFYMTTRYYSGSDKKKRIEKYCKENGLSKAETSVILYFAGFKSYREEVQTIAKRNGFSKSEIEDL